MATLLVLVLVTKRKSPQKNDIKLINTLLPSTPDPNSNLHDRYCVLIFGHSNMDHEYKYDLGNKLPNPIKGKTNARNHHENPHATRKEPRIAFQRQRQEYALPMRISVAGRHVRRALRLRGG